jgi:serine/threonine protein kinase
MISNKYVLIEKIGNGSFGTIYKGKNVRTEEYVAIKIELINSGTNLLKNESKIYQYLTGIKGVPNVKWFGKDDKHYFMVINLLGESIENLRFKRGPLSLKLTLQIGLQIINILESIHEKGLVHRDIKPDNFLLGLGENSKKLYLIDFGFCRSYLKNDNHIPLSSTRSLVGTPKFASINAHKLIELTRRDDLESLAYMLIYLHTCCLDDELLVNKQNTEYIDYIDLKENLNKIQTIPIILLHYLQMTRQIEFDEKPDYKKMSELFMKELETL